MTKEEQLNSIRTLISNPKRQEQIKSDVENHLSFCFGWQHVFIVTPEEIQAIVDEYLPGLPIKVEMMEYMVSLTPTTPLPDQPTN